MKSFKEFTKNSIVEGNINKQNWEGLKNFMKKQPGFVSWEFEGDYEELVIKYKNNKQAINAQKKSNASFIEISAFGDSSASNSEVRVELSKDAIKGMNESTEEITESKIELDDIGKDKTFLKQLKDSGITAMIKSKDLIIVDSKKAKEVKALLKDNGYSDKALTESDITEAVDAKKVYDYFLSTMTNVQKFGTYYSQDKGKVDKMNRRILSDYAGNPKKLKEIYKQLTALANSLDTEMTKLESIIG